VHASLDQVALYISICLDFLLIQLPVSTQLAHIIVMWAAMPSHLCATCEGCRQCKAPHWNAVDSQQLKDMSTCIQ